MFLWDFTAFLCMMKKAESPAPSDRVILLCGGFRAVMISFLRQANAAGVSGDHEAAAEHDRILFQLILRHSVRFRCRIRSRRDFCHSLA